MDVSLIAVGAAAFVIFLVIFYVLRGSSDTGVSKKGQSKGDQKPKKQQQQPKQKKQKAAQPSGDGGAPKKEKKKPQQVQVQQQQSKKGKRGNDNNKVEEQDDHQAVLEFLKGKEIRLNEPKSEDNSNKKKKGKKNNQADQKNHPEDTDFTVIQRSNAKKAGKKDDEKKEDTPQTGKGAEKPFYKTEVAAPKAPEQNKPKKNKPPRQRQEGEGEQPTESRPQGEQPEGAKERKPRPPREPREFVPIVPSTAPFEVASVDEFLDSMTNYYSKAENSNSPAQRKQVRPPKPAGNSNNKDSKKEQPIAIETAAQ